MSDCVNVRVFEEIVTWWAMARERNRPPKQERHQVDILPHFTIITRSLKGSFTLSLTHTYIHSFICAPNGGIAGFFPQVYTPCLRQSSTQLWKPPQWGGKKKKKKTLVYFCLPVDNNAVPCLMPVRFSVYYANKQPTFRLLFCSKFTSRL